MAWEVVFAVPVVFRFSLPLFVFCVYERTNRKVLFRALKIETIELGVGSLHPRPSLQVLHPLIKL